MDEYRIYRIASGRLIQEPNEELKKFQEELVPKLVSAYRNPGCVFGGIPGGSILSCASEHLFATFILKADIKNCFSNTTEEMVLSQLPFCVVGAQVYSLSRCFVRLGEKNILPTGAPTSPILLNYALYSFDIELQNLVRKEQELLGYPVVVTRYFDDIAISIFGPKRRWNLMYDVFALIKKYGYQPNIKKTRWSTRKSDNMKVVGVIQTEEGEFRIPRKKKLEIRAKLHHLARDNQELDNEAKGFLAYVSSISKKEFEEFSSYYLKKRQQYHA